MEPEINEVEGYLAPLKKVTPLSKYLAMLLFIIMPFLGGWIGYTLAPEKVVEVERVVHVQDLEIQESDLEGITADIDEVNLKYIDQKGLFSFEYPELLNLTKSGAAVELQHDIPYTNYGDCDMIGDTDVTYERLTDFKMTFKVVSPRIEPPYIDGEISSGSRDGNWAYQGAEGCGVIEYYFDIDDQRTLVIARDAVQALSGIVNKDVEKAVLAVPGVISKQESEVIFKQILSSLIIYDDSESL